jgi:uncharacterized membrane protein YdjX (TVP38/TMEM64 family)
MTEKQDFSARRRPSLVRLLYILCSVLLICLIFYMYHEGGWRFVLHCFRYFFEGKKLRAFLASFGPWAAPAFIGLQAFQVVVAPIPGEVTGFVGGLFFGVIHGTLLSTIGLTGGAVLSFWIARFFGSELVRRIVRKEYFDRLDTFMATHRALNITFVLFLIPGFPKDSLCYLLGLTRMRYRDIVVMNVFGRLPGTIILSMQGNAIRHGRFASFWLLLAGSLALSAGLYFGKDLVIQCFVWCRRELKGEKDNP